MSGPRELIDDEMRRFFLGPLSLVLATVDQMQVPDATRVAGVAPLGGRRARLLISVDARTAQANAVPGARIALLATDITDYLSLQLRGRVVTGFETRTPGDIALMRRHVDAFVGACPKVGIDPMRAPDLFPVDVVALIAEFDELYDQTPGPGAGRRVEVRT